MINPWVAARTFLIVSDSPNAFSYLRKGLLFYWAEKYFQALQESVFFVLIAIFSQPNEKANCAVYISLPGLCCITQHPLLSNSGSPLGFIPVFKINAAGGLSKSDTFFSQIENRLLFYVVTICPSAVHPVGCYYFTNSNNYQSSIPSEWNVDAECPRRYSKVFVYYNCVFTSTEKSNFVAVGNLVEGGTCITGKTVTIL